MRLQELILEFTHGLKTLNIAPRIEQYINQFRSVIEKEKFPIRLLQNFLPIPIFSNIIFQLDLKIQL